MLNSWRFQQPLPNQEEQSQVVELGIDSNEMLFHQIELKAQFWINFLGIEILEIWDYLQVSTFFR